MIIFPTQTILKVDKFAIVPSILLALGGNSISNWSGLSLRLVRVLSLSHVAYSVCLFCLDPLDSKTPLVALVFNALAFLGSSYSMWRLWKKLRFGGLLILQSLGTGGLLFSWQLYLQLQQ